VSVCLSVGHGHQQLHRVITMPSTQSNVVNSSTSSVPDWVQRNVQFGAADRKPLSQSRLSVSACDSLCHVPLSPQSSDASSGSAGADVDDSAGMQGTAPVRCNHPRKRAREYVSTGVGLCVCVSVCDHDN